VNLAVSVCEMLGIETEKCVETMKAYLKTRQNNTVTRVKLEFGELEFINAFAVNDIPSLDQFLKPFIKDQIPSFYLVNTRNDRPLRTVHFADWLAGHSGTDRIIIMGDHREKMKRLLIRRKVASHRVLLWNGKNMEELYTLFFREMKKIRLIGVANIAGQALKLCEELIEKGKNAA
jgi:hypothetical protein